MTTPKCPLCGETPQFATKDIDEIEVCQILCKCGLATEVNEYWLNPKDDPEEDELRAWKDWEKLVSKFPPLMRLQVNDIITYSSRYGQGINNAQVYEIFHDKNVISTSRGYCTPADVLKWPWELEQKGGAEQ